MTKTFCVVACAISFIASGCAHTNLAYDHINQARTLTNIHEKQVLDNLAMFLENPNALPFYAMPGTGSAQVTDNGSIGASTLNGPLRTVLGPLGLSRNNRLIWASTPVTDPIKLKRMRCAYRRALGHGDGSDRCIDCCELTKEWYASDEAEFAKCCDCCSVRPLKIERVGKHLAHKRCEKTGHYCGTTIRVCPESSADLTRLVMLVMDYAANKPKAKTPAKTMQVERHVYDDKGRVLLTQTYTAELKLDPNGAVIVTTEPQIGAVLEGKAAAAASPAATETPTENEGLRGIQELNILRNAASATF